MKNHRNPLSHFSGSVDSCLPVAFAISRCNGQPVILRPMLIDLTQLELPRIPSFRYQLIHATLHSRQRASNLQAAYSAIFRTIILEFSLKRVGNALQPIRGEFARGLPYFGISRSALNTGRLLQLLVTIPHWAFSVPSATTRKFRFHRIAGPTQPQLFIIR